MTRGTIHQVLINEKYIGNNVWNRGSFKLKRKRVRNSPDMWIRAEGAFEPIVDRSLFEAAQTIIRERSHKLSNEEMIAVLQQLLQDRGYGFRGTPPIAIVHAVPEFIWGMSTERSDCRQTACSLGTAKHRGTP